jgi:RNA polymerase sigma-70 factor (ECF subfamily)
MPVKDGGARTRARLLISQGTGQVAVRRAADRLEATAARTGYRRRRQLVHPPDADALVAAATERARDGDDDALRLIYLLYADNVFGYVQAIVRDEHDAEDITSEVFARLPRALTRYRVTATPFAAWLLRVARNAALDHLRAQRSVPLAEVKASGATAELQAGECLAGLRSAFEALPADQCQVMLLRLIAGLTPAEVAVHMDRSVDAVHALQHRARRRLRYELTKSGWAPQAVAA